ncbi:PAS domain-containing sensor histidine kinase, partial [Bradyrhizobium sp. Pear76]|nr:PAS domain-containing sensor histidine kinase [Bradyrhizobium oropedii]
LQRIGRGADRALIALIKPAPHLAARPAAPVAPETPVAAAPQEAATVVPQPAPAAVEQADMQDEAPAPASEAPATFTLFDALDPPAEAAIAEPIISPAESRPAHAAPSLAAAEDAHVQTAPVETAAFDTTPDVTPAVEEPLSEALIEVPAEAQVAEPAAEPAPVLEETAPAPASETPAPPADPVPSPYAIADLPVPPPVAEPEPVASAPAKPPSWLDEPLPVRRHPLRFMWQMDHEARFSLGSDEFTRLIGLHTAAGFGRLWSEIAESFGVDPEGGVMQAFASHDTWSGITLNWPVDGGGRLPVELSGLPVFDRNRNFAGYRGFGVCRDLDGLARLAALRRYEFFSGSIVPQLLSADVAPAPRTAAPPHESPPPHAEPPPDTNAAAPPEELTEPTAAETSHQADPDHAVETHEETQEVRHDTPQNVVPFRLAGDTRPPSLTPVENNAFNELARQLSARLESEAGLTAPTNDSATAEPIADEPSAGEPPQEAASQQEKVTQQETPAEPPKAGWLAAAE